MFLRRVWIGTWISSNGDEEEKRGILRLRRGEEETAPAAQALQTLRLHVHKIFFFSYLPQNKSRVTLEVFTVNSLPPNLFDFFFLPSHQLHPHRALHHSSSRPNYNFWLQKREHSFWHSFLGLITAGTLALHLTDHIFPGNLDDRGLHNWAGHGTSSGDGQECCGDTRSWHGTAPQPLLLCRWRLFGISAPW